MMKNNEGFTKGEELSNSISHGIGTLLSISALVLLVVFSAIKGNAWHIVSTAIYGSTLIILYLSSTLYHGIRNPKIKLLFERFDHSSIYVLIAGTYTPFTLVTLRGSLGWTYFGIIWALAILGIVFKAFFLKRFTIVSTIMYILMGWIVVFAFKPLLDSLPTGGIVLLTIGGVLYTVGTFFYLYRKFKFHHLIWHLFVLGGSITHFFAVFFYVIPN